MDFFWHSFDLAVTRVSGRRAPALDTIDRALEASSHEVISFGFRPGDDHVGEPSSYAYTAPERDDLTATEVVP